MAEEEKQTKKSKKKLWLIVTISIIAVVVTTAIFVVWYSSRPSVSQPTKQTLASIQNGIPLYYPKELPDGFSIDPSTIEARENVTVYQIKYGDDKTMFVSIQPVPDDFDFVGLYNTTLGGAQPVDSKLGEVYLGSFNNSSTASIKTSDAWILINGATGIGANEMKQVISGLHKIN